MKLLSCVFILGTWYLGLGVLRPVFGVRYAVHVLVNSALVGFSFSLLATILDPHTTFGEGRPVADPGGSGGTGPPCPQSFLKSCSFQAILRKNPQF